MILVTFLLVFPFALIGEILRKTRRYLLFQQALKDYNIINVKKALRTSFPGIPAFWIFGPGGGDFIVF